MKYRILITFILFCVFFKSFAQNLPVQKYSPNDNLFVKPWEFLSEDNQRFGLVLTYTQVNFLNKGYSENVLSSLINPKGGFSYGLRILLFKPFFIDGIGTYNEYEIEGTSTGFDGKIVELNSFEASVNMLLLPTGKYILPYFGLGFLSCSASDMSFNSILYKAGIQINFRSGKYSLIGEYKQSVNPSEYGATNHLSVGIVFEL